MSQSRQEALKKIFESLNRQDIAYVIPRKFDLIPDGIEENRDIDVFIKPSCYDEGIEIIEDCGFEPSHSHDVLSHYTSLAKKVIRQPVRAVKFLFRPQLVKQIATPTGSSAQKDTRFRINDIMLDVRNHLAYQSPMNDQWIRVDPYVEEKFFERRCEYQNFYIASPPDELAHIIPRYIYDKDGQFPEYYQNRADELFEIIFGHDQYDEQFRELLDKIFFSAAELVYELSKESRYNSIREELYKFSDY